MFLFKLAGHLHKSVSEIERTVGSDELTEWMAYHKYFHPIGDVERLLSMLIVAIIGGYRGRKGPLPKADAFRGVSKPPQHEIQIRDELDALALELQKWQRP